MGKTDWKAKAKKLKKQLASALTPAVAVKAAKPVSPLAPKAGFPTLPTIRGASFAAVEAGVR
jgi:glutamate N-acetyltransferase / amino-acid N-acetyltransferase